MTTQTGLDQSDRLTDRTTFVNLFQSEYGGMLHGESLYVFEPDGVVFVINQPSGDVQGWNIDRRSRSTVAQGHRYDPREQGPATVAERGISQVDCNQDDKRKRRI